MQLQNEKNTVIASNILKVQKKVKEFEPVDFLKELYEKKYKEVKELMKKHNSMKSDTEKVSESKGFKLRMYFMKIF